MSRDAIYNSKHDQIVDFSFDESVARVFPDMINRSVPGYAAIIAMIGILTERYARPDSICYDLGCSLGAATLSMRHQLRQPGCRIVSVDSSEAMLKRCREMIDADDSDVPVEIICGDIRDVAIRNASVVVLNFTLQFIPPAERLDILTRIYQGLLPGGLLVLSEKIAFDDERLQELHVDMHQRFKKSQGYSNLEISQKRTALENVLLPESLDRHRSRAREAGFSSLEVCFQCFNFASMLAFK